MPVFPVVARGANGLFGPTNKNHYYSPAYYHSKNAAYNQNKTRWSIKKPDEYFVFKLADEENWHCSVWDGLFSVLEKGKFIVGEGGEVLSFFPTPSNVSDPWHGFPVKSSSKRPDSALLERWVKEKVIDYSARIRIERGVL